MSGLSLLSGTPFRDGPETLSHLIDKVGSDLGVGHLGLPDARGDCADADRNVLER